MTRKEVIRNAFWDKGFVSGRMISGSKSGYRKMYPNSEVYFNANIVIESYGKIWFGDLDITKDRIFLEEISKEINEDLYILREMDARFEHENDTFEEYKKKAVCIIKAN